MAKINVVTPNNLGNTIKKDNASKKFEVNVDNSTITVNEQGQLVATGSAGESRADGVVWEGSINLELGTAQEITLSHDCRGKILHFFLTLGDGSINNEDSLVSVISVPVPAKAFRVPAIVLLYSTYNFYDNYRTFVIKPIKDSNGYKIMVDTSAALVTEGASNGEDAPKNLLTCKLITMS